MAISSCCKRSLKVSVEDQILFVRWLGQYLFGCLDLIVFSITVYDRFYIIVTTQFEIPSICSQSSNVVLCWCGSHNSCGYHVLYSSKPISAAEFLHGLGWICLPDSFYYFLLYDLLAVQGIYFVGTFINIKKYNILKTYFCLELFLEKVCKRLLFFITNILRKNRR